MRNLKIYGKRIIILIVLFSMGFSFLAHPFALAKSKLTVGDGEFYYAGTTEGSYVATTGIFKFLIDLLAKAINFIIFLVTMAPRMVVTGWLALIDKLFNSAFEMGVTRYKFAE